MSTLNTDGPENGYHLVITMINRGAVTLIIHDTSYDILIKIVTCLYLCILQIIDQFYCIQDDIGLVADPVWK